MQQQGSIVTVWTSCNKASALIHFISLHEGQSAVLPDANGRRIESLGSTMRELHNSFHHMLTI